MTLISKGAIFPKILFAKSVQNCCELIQVLITKMSVCACQVIQSDFFLITIWRSPTTFERVTFSPSQKGHKELSAVCFMKVASFFVGWLKMVKDC